MDRTGKRKRSYIKLCIAWLMIKIYFLTGDIILLDTWLLAESNRRPITSKWHLYKTLAGILIVLWMLAAVFLGVAVCASDPNCSDFFHHQTSSMLTSVPSIDSLITIADLVLNSLPDFSIFPVTEPIQDERRLLDWMDMSIKSKNLLAAYEERIQKLEARVTKAEDTSVELQLQGQKAVALETPDALSFERKLREYAGRLQDVEWRLAQAEDTSDKFLAVSHEVSQIIQELNLETKVAYPDYALEAFGGMIVDHSETYKLRKSVLSLFGIPLWYKWNTPRSIIQPGMSPGECWAFVGSEGYVKINLAETVRITGVSVAHISKTLLPMSYESSAPWEISVWEFSNKDNSNSKFLGRFKYDIHGKSSQYFNIKGTNPTKSVEFRIHSNHGNSEYTCIYRMAVHGEPVNG